MRTVSPLTRLGFLPRDVEAACRALLISQTQPVAATAASPPGAAS